MENSLHGLLRSAQAQQHPSEQMLLLFLMTVHVPVQQVEGKFPVAEDALKLIQTAFLAPFMLLLCNNNLSIREFCDCRGSVDAATQLGLEDRQQHIRLCLSIISDSPFWPDVLVVLLRVSHWIVQFQLRPQVSR